MALVEQAQADAFYRAATAGLRALDTLPGQNRRFGDEANARWQAFRGELSAADRLDLLIRDAAVLQPAGFAPRVIFALEGLADDEPFGPAWDAAPADAARAFNQPPEVAPSLARTLETAAEAWSLAPVPLSANELAAITPATKILAAGAGAVLSLAQAFSGRADLSLPDQVLLLADHPGHRQLFGLAATLLQSASPAKTIAPTAGPQDTDFSKIDLVLISGDAAPGLRAAADTLGRDLKA